MKKKYDAVRMSLVVRVQEAYGKNHWCLMPVDSYSNQDLIQMIKRAESKAK